MVLSVIEDRAHEIWSFIQNGPADYRQDKRGPAYAFRVGPAAQRRLSEIISVPLDLWQGEPNVVNCKLRLHVNQALHACLDDFETTGQLYSWIVAEWGGVKKGRSTVQGWALQHQEWRASHYDPAILMVHAGTVGFGRISSWSKIFAFAQPGHHAIYDSRVAVSLNLALEYLGEPARFFIPQSQSKLVQRVRGRLMATAQPLLGYSDYLLWLTATREQSILGGDPVDFLNLEATTFTRAPMLAQTFAD